MKRETQKQKPKSPPVVPPRREPLAEKLREVDSLDADFGEEFYQNMHDQIMKRIEQTPVEPPKTPTKRRLAETRLSLLHYSP